ncbi:MAG: VanW family protein [Candidatus Riflebacteria bacterium]|nr:VanW family protein [Candidatus Riflebacteria bacterium]
MRRILLTTAGLGALVLFLGFMVWGILSLQPHKIPDSANVTKPVPTPEVAVTKSADVTKIRTASVFFQNRTEQISFSDQTLLKITQVGGKSETMLDEVAASALIASLTPVKDLPGPTPGSLKREKNVLTRIIRGTPGKVIDAQETLRSLAATVKAHPDAQSYQVVVSYREDEGGQSFDALRNQEGFRELISTFETIHTGHITDAGRNQNLYMASLKCDGLVVQPGEEFNFDKVVGPRTKKNGFQEAGVISGGKVIPGLGGGVCQVSTTLYRCSLLANLKIIERHNHSIYEGIPYADRGLDAAVSWGSKNFRVKNTLDIPILISCCGSEGRVQASIYAARRPFESVKVVTRNEKATNFPIQKSRDPKAARPGVTGYTIESYRLVTINGSVQEEPLGRDLYQMFPQVEVASN